MPIELQTAHIPISGGVAEGSDELNLTRGQLVAARNVRFTKDGAVQKRAGNVLVSSASDVTGGWGTSGANTGEGRLIANNNRLLWVDGRAIHQYAPGVKLWSTKCVAPKFVGTSRPVASSNKIVESCAQAIGDNSSGRRYRVVAYCEHEDTNTPTWGGSVFGRVFDDATGAEVNTYGGSGAPYTTDNQYQLNFVAGALDLQNVQLTPVGTSHQKFIIATWTDENAASIFARPLDLDTMTWGGIYQPVTDNIILGAANRYDIKPHNSGFAIVYQDNSHLVKAKYCTVAASVVTVAATITLQDLSVGPIAATGFGITPTRSDESSHTHVWATWGYYDGTRIIGVTRPIVISGFSPVGAVTTVKQWAGLTAANLDSVVSSCSIVDDTIGPLNAKLGFTVFSGYSGGNAGSSAVLGHANMCTQFFDLELQLPTTIVVVAGTYFERTKINSTPFFSSGRCFCVMQREPGFHVDNGRINLFGSTTSYPSTSFVANQSSYFVTDIGSGFEDACFFPRQGFMSGMPDTPPPLSTVLLYQLRPVTQYVRSDIPIFTAQVFDAIAQRCSVHMVDLLTDDAFRYQSYSADGGAYISCGVTGYMDSRCFGPCGSPFGSGYITVDVTGGSSVFLTAGTSFVALYEYIDNDGNVQRSPTTSIFTDVSGAIELPYAIHVPYEWMGWDRMNVKTRTGYADSGNGSLVVYGGSSSASMYEIYRIEAPPFFASYWGGLTASTLALPKPTTGQDGKAFVYTQGNVLPDEIPPCAIGMCEYRRRLVLIDHTQRSLRFSKELVPGERAAFVDDLNMDVPFDAVAIHAMDGQLYVFGRNEIGILTGDGPNDTGSGGNFEPVQVISTDLGCINSRSIVKTPGGLMFQSPIGIYLIDRSGQVSFIGAPVMDTLASYPNVRSAIQHPHEPVVMFACNEFEHGGHGVRIVYNYRFDRWSVDDLVDITPILSQAVVGNDLYWLDFSGNVYKEDGTTNLDNGNWVTSSVTFASEKPGGAQTLHRFRCVGLLAKKLSPCDVNISVAYNDSQSYTYSGTFTDASIDSVSNLQFYPKQQLCRSYRVKFTDATPTSGDVQTGAGLSLSGIAVTLGIYGGETRLPANRSM